MDYEKLTEQETIEIVYQAQRKCGWKLCLYTREDVKTALQEDSQDYDTIPTNEEIEKVMETRMWRKYMEEALSTTGWECIQDAIYDAKEGEQKHGAATKEGDCYTVIHL